MLFSNVCISKDVATCFSVADIFYRRLTGNFILFLAVKNFGNLLTFGKVIAENEVPFFCGTHYTVYTGWPIKMSRTLALNYKTLKLKKIKLNIYFSKQTFTDTYTEIQVCILYFNQDTK